MCSPTCIPVADSFWYMAKPIQYCKVKKEKKKESACNMGHLGLIPGLGRPPGEGKVNPLQFWPGEFHGLYSLWGCKESETTERISLSLIMKSNQILQKLFFHYLSVKLLENIGFFIFFCFFFFFLFYFLTFTILYWFCHISKWIRHRYTCVPHPEPSSLPYHPSGSSQCTSPKHPISCIDKTYFQHIHQDRISI